MSLDSVKLTANINLLLAGDSPFSGGAGLSDSLSVSHSLGFPLSISKQFTISLSAEPRVLIQLLALDSPAFPSCCLHVVFARAQPGSQHLQVRQRHLPCTYLFEAALCLALLLYPRVDTAQEMTGASCAPSGGLTLLSAVTGAVFLSLPHCQWVSDVEVSHRMVRKCIKSLG